MSERTGTVYLNVEIPYLGYDYQPGVWGVYDERPAQGAGIYRPWVEGDSLWGKLLREGAWHWVDGKRTDRAQMEAPIKAHTDMGYAPVNAIDTQVGGDHYKKYKIQPLEYCIANNMGICAHGVVKYITRYKDKGGVEDLDKAIHYIQLIKEFEYGVGDE